MNPDIPLLLRPFAGRLASFVASLVLACCVKGIAILAAKSPVIAALIDPNQVADFIMIGLLAGINTATNYYHTDKLQPVADAMAAEEQKLKPPTLPPSTGFTVIQAMLSIVAIWAVTFVVMAFTGCANYAGPNMHFDIGYQGIDLGFTLYGKTPIAPQPVTVADAFPLPSSAK